MITLTEDTVFNTDAEWIVNTVNCLGVMGKGLALEFALRYPELDAVYTKQCRNKEINVGKIYDYNINGTNIINFPTKYDFRYPSQYKWIEEGLQDFLNNYKKLNIKSVAFPLLGCTNGELDKKIVLEMMKKYLDLDGVQVYICSSTKLAGKEKEMLEEFKNSSIEKLTDIAKLNKTQVEMIKINQMKVNRFYQILEIPKIGKTTYSKLFKYFYNGNDDNEGYVQLSIFDC